MNTMDDQLAARFLALGRFGRLVFGHVPDLEQAGVPRDSFRRLQALAERADARLRLNDGEDGHHTVVALAGATGVGKSSLFNALARISLSPSGHLRPTTGQVHACVWNAPGTGPVLDWLGVDPSRRFDRESALDAEDEAALRGLVLLDLPDVDSVAAEHRIEADRLVGIVDLVIWVLDPQKYADRALHEEYLRHMGVLRDVTVVVFNQVDRLTAVDADRCRADLSRLIEADGLPGVPIIATSTVSGAGIDEVRVLLEKTVAGRPAALARLEGELRATVESVSPLVSAEPVDEESVSREAVPELADGFAAAIGVGAIANEAGMTYRARAAVPGWPFHKAGLEANEMDVPPADPAAVGLAIRRLAARTSAGLPAPWPDEVRAAASTHSGRLPDDLAQALTTARSRLPGAAGWQLLRGLWWAAAVTAGAGIAALVWLVTTGSALSIVSSVVAVAGLGLAAAVLLPLIAGAVARTRGRRYRRHVEGRLREATLTVAREVVAPVRIVLRDYADARAALLVAADPD